MQDSNGVLSINRVFPDPLGVWFSKEQAGIDPAESERIRQRDLHRSRSGPVRNIVQITGRIRMVQVDRWRKNPVVKRQHTKHRFNPTGCAE